MVPGPETGANHNSEPSCRSPPWELASAGPTNARELAAARTRSSWSGCLPRLLRSRLACSTASSNPALRRLGCRSSRLRLGSVGGEPANDMIGVHLTELAGVDPLVGVFQRHQFLGPSEAIEVADVHRVRPEAALL